MSSAPPFALYNPAMLPPEVLLSEFTARRPLLAKLLDIIRDNAPGEPPQHVLIVGPRGMGKTTLLWAIAGSIALHEPDLNTAWQPVPFDEESRRIGDLADFWLECIRQWESATEPHLLHSQRLDALLADPGPDLEDQAREVFLGLVDASGKRALLLIDNLNDIFAAVHEVEALLRLRSFLMADSRVMIIGAATRWFEAVTGLDKPFFEFFRPFDLRPLDLQEMRECLAGIAEARGDEKVQEALKKRAGSIEVLHLLTGGNPRLIRTFYRLLSEGMNGELRHQLERLLDDYTPYHKAIIDALPGQQQRVLDAIALHWNPCDVASVARTTRLPSNQVSAQIKALGKAGLVSEVPSLGTEKKKAYLLTDRFSNIHYLMRHGRTGRLKMHWFVMTLRALFDDDSFAESAARAVRQTASGSAQYHDESLLIAQSALDCAGTETARRGFMDRIAGSMEFDADVDVMLKEKIFRQAIENNPTDAYAHFLLGRLLHIHLEGYNEAETEYRKAIQFDPKFDWPWISLGILLSQQASRLSEAEAAYREAIKLNPKDALPWHNLGYLLGEQQSRASEAEIAYRKAIDLDPKDIKSWNNLGHLLYQQPNRFSEAEAACRKAIDLNPKEAKPWNNLGILLNQQPSRLSEAEAAYRKAIDLDPKDAKPWNNLGYLLSQQPNLLSEAEIAYRKAINLDPMLANPCSGLALLLEKEGKGGGDVCEWATKGLLLRPDLAFAQYVFRKQSFSNSASLRAALPEVSLWCSKNAEAAETISFAMDAWVTFANVAGSAEALELLDAQPDEVRLAFESIRDAFLAHADKDHLHRLAPERRAPVLKLLERMQP